MLFGADLIVANCVVIHYQLAARDFPFVYRVFVSFAQTRGLDRFWDVCGWDMARLWRSGSTCERLNEMLGFIAAMMVMQG